MSIFRGKKGCNPNKLCYMKLETNMFIGIHREFFINQYLLLFYVPKVNVWMKFKKMFVLSNHILVRM